MEKMKMLAVLLLLIATGCQVKAAGDNPAPAPGVEPLSQALRKPNGGI